MAREFGPVNVDIWSDPEWRQLPPAAQHLYLTLWTSPGLTYCGTHDWRPNRLAKLAHGFTAEHVQTVGDCLTARHFLVVDTDTEEVLIRSWARFDKLVRKPRMAVSYSTAYAAVASPTLRRVLAHETRKMRDLWPELACWSDPRVAEILSHPCESAKDLPTPDDPFDHRFAPEVALGLPLVCGAFVANGYSGLPLVCDPPTPAPAPAPKPLVVKGGVGGNAPPSPERRKRRLPEDWRPTDRHASFAAENRLDTDAEAEQFRDHHTAKGSLMLDWDAAFRTWLRNAVKFRKPDPEPPRILTRPYEQHKPPDGLSPEEYSAWLREVTGR